MGMGVVAVFSGQNRIALHPGALRALQEIHLLQLGKNVRCAAVWNHSLTFAKLKKCTHSNNTNTKLHIHFCTLHGRSDIILIPYHKTNFLYHITKQKASSANTPRAVQIGRSSLKMLEVIPGVTIMEVLMAGHAGIDINQIGRSYPLSEDKAKTHFPFLRKV